MIFFQTVLYFYVIFFGLKQKYRRNFLLGIRPRDYSFDFSGNYGAIPDKNFRVCSQRLSSWFQIIFISLYIETRERLIRFRVVAEYHRINSKGVSFVIQPDQSIAQIIPNVRRVSIARKTNGL